MCFSVFKFWMLYAIHWNRNWTTNLDNTIIEKTAPALHHLQWLQHRLSVSSHQQYRIIWFAALLSVILYGISGSLRTQKLNSYDSIDLRVQRLACFSCFPNVLIWLPWGWCDIHRNMSRSVIWLIICNIYNFLVYELVEQYVFDCKFTLKSGYLHWEGTEWGCLKTGCWGEQIVEKGSNAEFGQNYVRWSFIRSILLWHVTQCRVVILHGCFGTTYRILVPFSRVKKSSDLLTLEDGTNMLSRNAGKGLALDTV
jgi:hypothetical protein